MSDGYNGRYDTSKEQGARACTRTRSLGKTLSLTSARYWWLPDRVAETVGAETFGLQNIGHGKPKTGAPANGKAPTHRLTSADH